MNNVSNNSEINGSISDSDSEREANFLLSRRSSNGIRGGGNINSIREGNSDTHRSCVACGLTHSNGKFSKKQRGFSNVRIRCKSCVQLKNHVLDVTDHRLANNHRDCNSCGLFLPLDEHFSPKEMLKGKSRMKCKSCCIIIREEEKVTSTKSKKASSAVAAAVATDPKLLKVQLLTTTNQNQDTTYHHPSPDLATLTVYELKEMTKARLQSEAAVESEEGSEDQAIPWDRDASPFDFESSELNYNSFGTAAAYLPTHQVAPDMTNLMATEQYNQNTTIQQCTTGIPSYSYSDNYNSCLQLVSHGLIFYIYVYVSSRTVLFESPKKLFRNSQYIFLNSNYYHHYLLSNIRDHTIIIIMIIVFLLIVIHINMNQLHYHYR